MSDQREPAQCAYEAFHGRVCARLNADNGGAIYGAAPWAYLSPVTRNDWRVATEEALHHVLTEPPGTGAPPLEDETPTTNEEP